VQFPSPSIRYWENKYFSCNDAAIEVKEMIVNTRCDFKETPEKMTEMQKERVVQANRVYCEACEEKGIKVCSWKTSAAWQEYVDGKIGESELNERARDELKQITETFKKYTVVSGDEPAASQENATQRQRAKYANQVYKRACTDSGMNHCFFSNFSAWSDFVYGRIDESEFYERSKSEVEKMLPAE
jgi:hypothetical protein